MTITTRRVIMTMHLVRGLSTTGRSRKKQKWASSEQKRQAQELEQSWAQIKSQSASKSVAQRPLTKPVIMPKIPAGRDTTSHIKSHDSGIGNAARADTKVYTGDKVMGISIVHKSCLQPVFSQEQARDLASMRR
jgi:hypothetical protein